MTTFIPFVVSPAIPFVVSPVIPFVVSPVIPFVVSPVIPFVVSPVIPFVVSLSNHERHPLRQAQDRLRQAQGERLYLLQ